MAESVTVALGELEATARRALDRLGLEAGQRDGILDELLHAEFSGKRSHGLVRIPWLAAFPGGWSHTAPRARQEGASISHYDCAGAVGYLAAREIARATADKANAAGFHLSVAHDVFPTGVLSYYLSEIVDAGLLGAAMGRTPWLVKTPQASRRFLGTNPLAFGFPGEAAPFLCDITTAPTSFGQFLLARAGIEPFEPEKFLTAGGETPAAPDDLFDAKGRFAGAILQALDSKPDARQFALLMAVEVAMAFLAGADKKGGLVMIALKPDYFPGFSPDAARAVLATASEAMDPAPLPGAHGEAARAAVREAGALAVEGALWEQIAALAADD